MIVSGHIGAVPVEEMLFMAPAAVAATVAAGMKIRHLLKGRR